MRPTNMTQQLCEQGLLEGSGLEWEVEWPPEFEAPGINYDRGIASAHDAVDLMVSLQSDLVQAWERAAKLNVLERQILLLERRVHRLEHTSPVTVPVQSLAPDPYDVLTTIQIVVRAQEDEYLATFFDANLSASGETPEEAVMGLKDVIAAAYEALSEHEEEQLGPGPARQLAVLREFIRART